MSASTVAVLLVVHVAASFAWWLARRDRTDVLLSAAAAAVLAGTLAGRLAG